MRNGAWPNWLSWALSGKSHSAVFTVAVTVFAAVAAATGAIFVAPSVLGRNLASYELAVLAVVLAALGWGFTASHRRRARKRILEMRDSALW